MPLQAAVSPRQYLQDATLAQYIFNGMKCLAILSLVILIGMAEYCLKIGRIPPKSEWLAAMLLCPFTSCMLCNQPFALYRTPKKSTFAFCADYAALQFILGVTEFEPIRGPHYRLPSAARKSSDTQFVEVR